jgi:hypothetical protein
MSTTTRLSIGDKMPDGTIFAGTSPDTGKPMYALPADAPLTMQWQQAMDYAADFEGHGHPKGAFRVPTQGELNVLFQNKAKIGGFNANRSIPAAWYWSSTEHPKTRGWVIHFPDGDGGWHPKRYDASLRLVRS